ncbi:hypothetical protein C5167_000111 [Papaver somniferum]|uniref:Pectin acetylesterase n=1 Tax=Papaver somniferum TaxID=3469 RepID=A0A4Y7KUB5_PAPSO|nr:pectin acetylesterase 5-like [Papaver somniferum]RZC75778.1 hypothetical protein C5167_000111 [Papaver somniferum]
MGKLQTPETAYFQKVERNRGCVANRRTKDYVNNGIRLLVVFMVIVYSTKTTNALPPPSSPSVDFIILHNATELGAGVSPSKPTPYPSGNDPNKVNLHFLQNAKELGAVCLDGSKPGYYFSKGFGSGSNNWLIHIEGGGWCDSIESCYNRTLSPYGFGSSKFMGEEIAFSGILSSNKSQNPDFYNWNRVKVHYCDGASFSGTPMSENENTTRNNLFFRGKLIWDAVMDELLNLGLSNAKQAFLTGCSAGGLSTLIKCDSFAEFFPNEVKVKCLSDAGFFMDEKDMFGGLTMRSFFHEVVKLQGVETNLNKHCLAELKPFPGSLSQCLFPQNFVKYIKTPLFLVNPTYDWWQIGNILHPPTLNDGWVNCTNDIALCNKSQLQKLHGFRHSMLKELTKYKKQKNMGMFIDSCFAHCQTDSDKWHLHSPKINNKTIAEAVGDWYFNRKTVHEIDNGLYRHNPTCSNKVWE